MFSNIKYKMDPNREFTSLKYDYCQMKEQEKRAQKPLKYYTTDFKNLENDSKDLNSFDNKSGQLISNLNFDLSNDELRYQQVKFDKTCRELGELPFPTLPFRGNLNFGDIENENKVRFPLYENDRRNSVLPRDNEYYNRSFDLFDKEDQPSLYVEPWNPAGVSTRYLAGDPKLYKK